MDELVEKAKNNDIDAFTKITLLLENDLERFARKNLIDDNYAKDVVQETFIKVFLNLDQLNDNKKFKSWIFTILKHECSNINIKTARLKEDNIDNITDILIDYSNSNQISKYNFEEMISKLSDSEKKLIRMKFEENYSNMEISEELGIPYNTIRSKINRALKKITLIVLILILFSGFTVLAAYIIEQIKIHFTTSLNAIDEAVENNYVQQIEDDFVYDNNIGIKVDAIVLDDKNLDISFMYDIKDKYIYSNISGIKLNDYIIKDENSVLYESKHSDNKLIDYSNTQSENLEKYNNYFINSILFSSKNIINNISIIFIEINSIYISLDNNNSIIINGNWKLEYNISEKLNNRKNITYSIEENEYVENYNIVLSDTSLHFKIYFNSNFEYSYEKIKNLFLIYDNKTLNCINCIYYENEKFLKCSFDIGKYSNNNNNLLLEIPLTNNNSIILKIKKDP